jgi:hypothetical protein
MAAAAGDEEHGLVKGPRFYSRLQPFWAYKRAARVDMARLDLGR